MAWYGIAWRINQWTRRFLDALNYFGSQSRQSSFTPVFHRNNFLVNIEGDVLNYKLMCLSGVVGCRADGLWSS